MQRWPQPSLPLLSPSLLLTTWSSVSSGAPPGQNEKVNLIQSVVSWGFIHTCKPQTATTTTTTYYSIRRNQNTVLYSLLLISLNAIKTRKNLGQATLISIQIHPSIHSFVRFGMPDSYKYLCLIHLFFYWELEWLLLEAKILDHRKNQCKWFIFREQRRQKFVVRKSNELKNVSMLSLFRELKRLESLSRSPVYSHVSESVGGTVVVRAYSHQRRFTDVFLHRLDSNLSAFILLQAGNRWLGICLVSHSTSQLCIFKCSSSNSSRLLVERSTEWKMTGWIESLDQGHGRESEHLWWECKMCMGVGLQ